MAQALGWRVTAQQHTEEYTPNGSFQPVVKVSIITDAGTPATFSFPEAQYNPDAVVARVNEFVSRESAVAALGNS